MAASGFQPVGICTFTRQNVPEALSTAEHRQCIPQVAMPHFPPCHRLQQDLILTGGPARPTPGTPLSPGCPGRPGAPLSPWNKGKSQKLCALMRKCTEMQPGYRPECRMSTSGLDPAYRGTNSACGSTGIWHSYCLSMPIKCPFSTTGVPAHLCGLSLCHVTSHNWVETQSLQACSFILAHCIEFPAFHRITKVGRDLHDQLVQPPAQHHVIQSKQFPQEPHPEPFQEQWLLQGSRHFPWLGETLKHRQPLFPLCASMVEG